MLTPAKATHRAALTVVALTFILNLMSRMGETFAVFLLPIETEFEWNRATLSTVYGLYMGAHGVSGILIGALVDRVGPRLVYTLGLLLYSTAFFLAQFANAPWHLFLTTGVLAGIAMTSIGMTTATVLLTGWYRGDLERWRPIAISVTYSGLGAGVILWVPIAHILIENFGWRTAYLWLSISTLCLAAIVYLLPWNHFCSPLLARTVTTQTSPPFQRLGILTVAGQPTFWPLFAVLFLTAIAIFSIAPQLVAYLVAMGFGKGTATIAYSVNGMMALFGITATGWLVSRFGSRRAATATYMMTILGLVALSLLIYSPQLVLLSIAILAGGLSQGSRGPIVSTLVSRLYPATTLGLVHGAVTMGIGLGGMIGAALSGLLVDLTGGYGGSFTVAIIAAGLACSLFWSVKELRNG